MEKENYTVFADAGHSWMKVKKEELKHLKIADKISHCSYQKGDFAFLEEDCDAGLFIDAKKKIGIEVTATFKYVDESPIRNYDIISF